MYELRDYNIWKDGDTYMVKVKDTGEVTPASQEIIRVLWKTEISSRRALKDDCMHGLFSYDEIQEDGCALIESIPIGGSRDIEENVIWNITNGTYKTQLTEKQKFIYDLCYVKGLSGSEAASCLGLSYSTIRDCKNQIIDKLTKSS